MIVSGCSATGTSQGLQTNSTQTELETGELVGIENELQELKNRISQLEERLSSIKEAFDTEKTRFP